MSKKHQTMQDSPILSPSTSPEYFPSTASVLPQYCPNIAPSAAPLLSPVLHQYCSQMLLHTYCLSIVPVLPQNCSSTDPQHSLSTVSILSQLPQHCLSTAWVLVWQQGGGEGVDLEHVCCLRIKKDQHYE